MGKLTNVAVIEEAVSLKGYKLIRIEQKKSQKILHIQCTRCKYNISTHWQGFENKKLDCKGCKYINIENDVLEKGYILTKLEHVGRVITIYIQCGFCSKTYIKVWQDFARNPCICECQITENHVKEMKQYIESCNYQILKIGNYDGVRTMFYTVCPNNHNYDVRYTSFYHGKNRCAKCKFIHNGDRCRKSIEKVIKRVNNNGFELLTKTYQNNSQELKIQCKQCKNIQFSTLRLIKKGVNCRKCENKGSLGEKKIRKFLNKYDIRFNEQEKLLEMSQRFDFYLNEAQIYVEFQGKQHYRPIQFFGGISKFTYQINLDINKIEWILNNKKIMLYFYEKEYKEYKYYFKCQYPENRGFLRYKTHEMIFNHCEKLYDYLESLSDKEYEELEDFPHDRLEKVYLQVQEYLNNCQLVTVEESESDIDSELDIYISDEDSDFESFVEDIEILF
jgi:hypothetical protein